MDQLVGFLGLALASALLGWVKLDTRFTRHPKVLSVSIEAAWLHLCAISYANEHLTDGFIPAAAVRHLDVRVKHHKRCVAELCDAGLWEVAGSGYQIHDYLHYNLSAEEVRAEEEQRVAQGRVGGHRSVAVRRVKYGSAQPPRRWPPSEAKPEASASESSEATPSDQRPNDSEALSVSGQYPVRKEQEGIPDGLRQEEEDAAVVVDPLAAEDREAKASRAACEKNGDGDGGSPRRGGRLPAARNGQDPTVARLRKCFVAFGQVSQQLTPTFGAFDDEDLGALIRQQEPEQPGLVKLAMRAWFESPLRAQRDSGDFSFHEFFKHFDQVVKVHGLARRSATREAPEGVVAIDDEAAR